MPRLSVYLSAGYKPIPWKQDRQALTKWTAAKLVAAYKDRELMDHLTVHLYKITRRTTGYCLFREAECDLFTFLVANPIIQSCMRKQEEHLIESTTRRMSGICIAMELWEGDRKTEVAEHLVEFLEMLGWLVNEIKNTVQALTDLSGEGDVIEEMFETMLSHIPPEPPTVERPYHLHVSEHAAGGGNETLIHERLSRNCQWLMFAISHPPWWHKFLFTRGFAVETSINTRDDKPLLYEEEDWAYGVSRSLCVAHCLEHFVVPEIHAMLHELNGWRKCAAGLALHERVGKDSALYALGPDVLRMVLRWM